MQTATLSSLGVYSPELSQLLVIFVGINFIAQSSFHFPQYWEEGRGENISCSFLPAFRCAHKTGISCNLVVKRRRFISDHFTLKQVYKVECTGDQDQGVPCHLSPRGARQSQAAAVSVLPASPIKAFLC